MVSGWQVMERDALSQLVKPLWIEGELKTWRIVFLFHLLLLITHNLLQFFVGMFKDRQQCCVSCQERLEERFGLSSQYFNSFHESEFSTLMLESREHSFESLFR